MLQLVYLLDRDYITAVVTTAIVLIVLVYFGGLEEYVKVKQKKLKRIDVIIADRPGQLGKVSSALGELEIHIRKVEMSEALENQTIKISILCNIPYNIRLNDALDFIRRVDGVFDVQIC